ncbi:MAG: flagellar hook-associated protein FlgL [Gammaproteobacteria bacterium]|jgi:flagellar hook-associated protein 3 FlgL|nr:flagellar hook-associated protein FlgL [Gammaproteobacteria bacterium]MBU0772108.1 flagellar hook-associated protein FlgL [Gammaproteobacteria bacterium]MBU1848755.1 flagellar hook-associated protein FlgL [Gammaproteobacteria bacterium]
MRISTNTIYDMGTAGLIRQSSDLYRTQQQLSTGRRVLAPSDDPVAASRALEIDQSKAINDQFAVNRRDAASSLGFAESQIYIAEDILSTVRARVVQAGSAALGDEDRKAIATDLRAMFSELMGIANSRDASGDYLFAGYKSTTQPFSGSVEAGVSYAGDDGQREAQVGSNRRLAVSDSGNDVFMRVPSGNGRFALTPDSNNRGTAVLDAGSVTDMATWNDPANPGDFNIVFDVSGGVTTYDIIDNVSGNSLLTGAAPGGAPLPRTFQPGDVISLRSSGAEPPFNYGARFSMTGAPADGDSVNLKISSSQSVFETLGDVIKALETPASGDAVALAKISNAVGSALSNIDQATDVLLSAHARIGSRTNELDALDSLGEEVNLQFETALSGLRDLNYTEAISRFTQQQAYLQAAQQSFLKMSGLSLFNYIGA